MLAVWGAFASRPQRGEAMASRQATTAALSIVVGADVDSLDPATATSAADRQVMNALYDRLFHLTPEGSLKPMLATGYTVSKDLLTYTLSLRRGVRFTDGTRFTSAVVVADLRRYALSPQRAVDLAPIAAVTALGAYRVRIALTRPDAPLLTALAGFAGMMCSASAPPAQAGDLASCAGSGAYRILKRVPGSSVTLVRNVAYWNTAAMPTPRIVIRVIADAATRLQLLRAGAVDLAADIPAPDVAATRVDAALRVVRVTGYGGDAIALNTSANATGDAAIRQALALMIDRPAFVRGVYGAAAVPAVTPLLPAQAATGAWDRVPVYNLSRARTALVRGNGANLTFTLLVASDPQSMSAGRLLVSMFTAAGLYVPLEVVSPDVLTERLAQHQFEAALTRWAPATDADLVAFPHLSTGGAENNTQISSATLDAALNAARAEPATKFRKQQYGKVDQELRTAVPYIFLDHPVTSYAMRRTVQGFAASPDGVINLTALHR